jgi:hypothetical protein
VEGAMWENAWEPTLGTQAWIDKAQAVMLYHALGKYVIEFSTNEKALYYEVASHWIVYDPRYSVEALAEVNPAARSAGGNDTTFPEQEIVPSQPLIPTPADRNVARFETEPGLFVREYAQCYEAGVPIGGCAAIVNTTGEPLPLAGLRQRYGRVLVRNYRATWAAGGVPFWSRGVPAEIGGRDGFIVAR